MSIRQWWCLAVIVCWGVASSSSLQLVGAADRASALAAIRQVGLEGSGHEQATAAVAQLSLLDAKALPIVLTAMDGASPLAKNWLIGVAGTLADRGELPIAELEKYFQEQSHDADARYWVFQLLTANQPDVQAKRLDQMLDDPGPELKFLAVEHYLKKFDLLKASGTAETQIKLLAKLLEAARHPAQIQTIAGHLKDLDRPVDLQRHFGFLAQWQVIGPFDNRGNQGFDIAYAPEKIIVDPSGTALDLAASLPGKSGPVSWQKVDTDKEDGTVDLNPVFNNEKGAVSYAVTTFNSATEQPCHVRLGSMNANQVWLNGEKLLSNDVYHAGNAIDQYIGSGMLKRGSNTILLKLCQNEQTESWAQDWTFQLRVTDLTGKALVPVAE